MAAQGSRIARAADPSLDHYRWIRSVVRGLTDQEIADEDGCSPSAVRRSITRYDRTRAALTREEMEATQIAILQRNSEEQARALHRALTATKTIDALGSDGKPVAVETPDYDVQLRAVEAQTAMVNALRPKGGINISQNNANFNAANQSAGARDSMESHLETVLERRRSLGPAVIEAEFNVPDCIVPVDPTARGDDQPEDDDDPDAEDDED